MVEEQGISLEEHLSELSDDELAILMQTLADEFAVRLRFRTEPIEMRPFQEDARRED